MIDLISGIMLSIGCTSGQLLVLHWESPPTIFTSPPAVLNICNEVDDISIDNMKWTSMVCIYNSYIYIMIIIIIIG